MSMGTDLQQVEFEGNGIRRKWHEPSGRMGYVGIDALAAMGAKAPTAALPQIVRHDKLGELKPHTWTDTVLVQGQRRKVRMFSKQGLSLLAMKAQTEKAAAFRAWLAELVEALDEGKVTLVPGPNADPSHIAQRVEAREQTIQAGKAAHHVISEVGGQFYHHINYERFLTRRIHGCDPKDFKTANDIPKSHAVADHEDVEALGIRAFCGAVLARRYKLEQVGRANLTDQLRTIPSEVAGFFEAQTGAPLLDVGALPDIRPHVNAERDQRKRLAAPVNGGQLRLDIN